MGPFDLLKDDVAGAVYFLDPVTDRVETPEQRSVRMYLYDLLCQSLPNHSHLEKVCQMGDFAKLFSLARVVAVKDDVPAMMQAFVAMANLRKDHSVPWSRLAAQVTEISAVISSNKQQGMMVGDQLLPEFLLRAMEGDARWATELALMRKREKTPPLDVIMTEFTKASNTVEASTRKAALTGLPAVASPGATAGPTGPTAEFEARVEAQLTALAAAVRGQARGGGICFNFQKEGKCKYGNKCKFVHKPLTGGCAECGGQHDVAKCEARAKRLADLGTLEARIAQLEASGAADLSVASSGGQQE